MNFEFTIDEDEFLQALRNIEITDEDLMHVAGAGSAVIKTHQKLKCPVDLGALRASIAEEFKKGDAIASIEIGPSMDYAPYVEFGTGEFALNGRGRKGGWVYKGRHGFRFTLGNRPQPFIVPSAFGESLTQTIKSIEVAFAMLVQSKWKK